MDECEHCGAPSDMCCCLCFECGEPHWGGKCDGGPMDETSLVEAASRLLESGIAPAELLARLNLRPLSRKEPE